MQKLNELCIHNSMAEKEFAKAVPVIIAAKKLKDLVKNLEIKLAKGMRDLNAENYKNIKEKIEDIKT